MCQACADLVFPSAFISSRLPPRRMATFALDASPLAAAGGGGGGADGVHGASRDAAEFMAELQVESPDTYDQWHKLTSREDFNEKFRRS